MTIGEMQWVDVEGNNGHQYVPRSPSFTWYVRSTAWDTGFNVKKYPMARSPSPSHARSLSMTNDTLASGPSMPDRSSRQMLMTLRTENHGALDAVPSTGPDHAGPQSSDGVCAAYLRSAAARFTASAASCRSSVMGTTLLVVMLVFRRDSGALNDRVGNHGDGVGGGDCVGGDGDDDDWSFFRGVASTAIDGDSSPVLARRRSPNIFASVTPVGYNVGLGCSVGCSVGCCFGTLPVKKVKRQHLS